MEVFFPPFSGILVEEVKYNVIDISFHPCQI